MLLENPTGSSISSNFSPKLPTPLKVSVGFTIKKKAAFWSLLVVINLFVSWTCPHSDSLFILSFKKAVLGVQNKKDKKREREKMLGIK